MPGERASHGCEKCVQSLAHKSALREKIQVLTTTQEPPYAQLCPHWEAEVSLLRHQKQWTRHSELRTRHSDTQNQKQWRFWRLYLECQASLSPFYSPCWWTIGHFSGFPKDYSSLFSNRELITRPQNFFLLWIFICRGAPLFSGRSCIRHQALLWPRPSNW